MPKPTHILSFGRFRGHSLADVPAPYLLDLLKKFEQNPAPPAASVNLTPAEIRAELVRRELGIRPRDRDR